MMKAQQFQTIVQEAADGILVVDADGVVLFANRASEVLLDRAATELTGTSLGQPIVADGSTEMAILRKSGELVTVEMRSADITWDAAPAVLASLRDVSERVRTSAQIENLNSLLRAVRSINQLIVREKDPTALTTRACELLVATRRYCGAWIAAGDGRGPSEVLAQAGWGDEFAPFAASLRQGTWPPCLGECLASDDVLAVHDMADCCAGCTLPNACEQRTSLVTTLGHSGHVLGLMGVSLADSSFDEEEEERSLLSEVAEDIALGLHTIEIEREQRETERRLQSAVMGGGVGLWDWDLETNQVFFSAEWKAQIGYRPEEIGDDYEEWAGRLHPDDLEPTLERVQTALKLPRRPYQAEFRLRHRDGTYRWIEARGSVDVDANNQPTRLRGTHVDVTARRLEEDRHRFAQQVAHLGHWELDALDGKPVWSDEVFRIFGLDSESAEPSFTKHDTIVHPEDWPLLDDAVRAGFEHGTPFDLVFRILRPGQEQGWMHAIGNATRDAGGKVVRMFGTAQDVTALKQGELALRYTNELLSQYVLNSPVYTYLKEVSPTDSRVVLASENYRDMIGIPGSEMVGKSMAELFPAELAAAITHDDWRVVDGGEIVEVDEDLDGRSYTSIKFPVQIGERRLLAGYSIDITNRRRAEEELRDSRQLLKGILDSIPARVFWKDKDLVFLGCNAVFARDAGFSSPRDVIGKDDHQMCWRAEADLYRAADRQVIESGHAQLLIEEPQTTPTGRTITLLTGRLPLRNAAGEITGVLGTYLDITEMKELQAQLAQADRLSSMGMLAAGVAHEINNPLSYMLYNLESLREDLPKLFEAVRQTQAQLGELGRTGDLHEKVGPAAVQMMNPVMLDDIMARFKDALGGTYRIRDVARGLGSFSRVEEDQLVPVNLAHVIDVATTMATNEIKYRARLVKHYGSKVPTVMAGEGRLSQVFLNLILNATHAIDEGDVENNELQLTTWAEGDYVCAQVRDTGTGIAPENLDKLFEPFFTTKKIGAGSGLGLAISKGIVEGYGGTIEVESEVGTGTCFTVRLPVGAAAAAERVPAEAEEEPVARGRILVVDDEDVIRAVMVRMLRDHDVVQAASGAEAMEILENDQDFDVILSDMMMSDVSGMDLHEWLTDRHPRLAEQFVFITGGAFTPRARDYLSRVDNIRLEKPFDAANFKKIVGELILAHRTNSGLGEPRPPSEASSITATPTSRANDSPPER